MQLSKPDDYVQPSRFIRGAMRFGAFRDRSMYWWWGDEVNFGDWVGPLIFEWRTGSRPLYRHYATADGNPYFISAGSVLAFDHRADRAIVWGAGVHNPNKRFARPRKILAVRGRLTREVCIQQGFACPEAFGDPGILLPEVLGTDGARNEYAVGVVIHYIDKERLADLIPKSQEVLLIDVNRSVQEVYADIGRCAHIVSSSLHGLVVAHALGIPAAWLELSRDLPEKDFKYHDYYSAYGLGEGIHPIKATSIETVADMIRHAQRMPLPDTGKLKEQLLDSCPF